MFSAVTQIPTFLFTCLTIRLLYLLTISSINSTVAKDSSNPVLLKLVLQGLAAEWNIDTELINNAHLSSKNLSNGGTELLEGPHPIIQLQTEGKASSEEHQNVNSAKTIIYPPSPTPPPSLSPSPVSTPHWLPPGSVSGCDRGSLTPSSVGTGFTDQIGNVGLGHSSSWPAHKPRRIGIRHVARLVTGL